MLSSTVIPAPAATAPRSPLKWERICNACSYDIEIMDEEGNVIVEWG